LPATPPLPGDLVQQINAGLRSRNADRKRAAMEAWLAARAFPPPIEELARPLVPRDRAEVGPGVELDSTTRDRAAVGARPRPARPPIHPPPPGHRAARDLDQLAAGRRRRLC